jgi:hypothetical protein
LGLPGVADGDGLVVGGNVPRNARVVGLIKGVEQGAFKHAVKVAVFLSIKKKCLNRYREKAI